jgi:hypothetical protein
MLLPDGLVLAIERAQRDKKNRLWVSTPAA